MVTANVVPDLLRNVRSNLNENRSPSTLAAALPHSPIPIGENISGKTNNISIDSLISSATMTATPQRYFLEQIGKAATENKGRFQFYYQNIFLTHIVTLSVDQYLIQNYIPKISFIIRVKFNGVI